MDFALGCWSWTLFTISLARTRVYISICTVPQAETSTKSITPTGTSTSANPIRHMWSCRSRDSHRRRWCSDCYGIYSCYWSGSPASADGQDWASKWVFYWQNNTAKHHMPNRRFSCAAANFSVVMALSSIPLIFCIINNDFVLIMTPKSCILAPKCNVCMHSFKCIEGLCQGTGGAIHRLVI